MIERALDDIDLSGLHAIATIYGAMVSVYMLSLTDKVNLYESLALRFLQRLSTISLGLAMCWSYLYSFEKGWAPWPPYLAMILSVDMMMTVRVISLHLWTRRHVVQTASSN